MNHVVANQFKMIFETQKNEILLANQVAVKGYGLSSDDLSDEADLASAVLEQGLKLQLRSRETLFLKKINEALVKIKEGTFGMCACCEEDIELSRLEVRPTATLCINCKELEEMKETRLAETHNNASVRMMRLA